MKPPAKPLDQQVVVLTGASSGIGLATARALAERGATLMLGARNADALGRICEDLRGKGARCEFVETDVGDQAQVKALAAAAVERFGGFDTWINDAGVSIYGKAWDVPIEDARKLFETNYWGGVYGALAAVEHLRDKGGRIITVASVLSDFSIPEQGAYCASKHALKGFFNGLREELIGARVPVSVTLIKPSATATPYPEHAVSYMDRYGRLPPPLYAPELVADAIVHACEHPARELTVGFAGKGQTLLFNWAPWLAEPLYGWVGKFLQSETQTVSGGKVNLYEAGTGGRAHGNDRFVRQSSLFLEAQKQPLKSAAVVVGAALTALAIAAVNARVQEELRVHRRVKAWKASHAAPRKRVGYVPWKTSRT